MPRPTVVILCSAFLFLAHAGNARAQSWMTDKISLNVNAGYQLQSHDVASTSGSDLYGETGTFTTSQTIDKGFVFHASAEYKLSQRMGLGIGWSLFSKSGPIQVTAQLPHPLFTNQFRVASVAADGAKHQTQTLDFDAVYRWPFSKKIDLVFSAGPSIAFISQELVTGVTMAPETYPSFSSPTIQSVTVAKENKTTFGFNAGADAAYMFTRRLGAGFGVRYVYASAKLPGADDSLKVGGLQVLGGLRVRF